MFGLLLMLVFIAAPAALGFLSARYWTALIPGAIFVLATAGLVINPPSHEDEVDVIPGLLTVGTGVAVLVCCAAAFLGKRAGRGRDVR